MSECIKSWTGKPLCKFEARYDETSEVAKDTSQFSDVSANAIFWGREVPTNRTKTYVHDVCVRCGKVINRP